MSRIYDNWDKLVGAVLRREKDRQLAYCESFSSLGSADVSSRPSFASDVPADLSAAHGIFVSHNTMVIPFEEIKLATKNFQPDMLLGEGRFGPVFKGWIHEHFLTAVKPGFGIAVAVKKLNEREIYYFNQPRHPNLVKLIGYGFEGGNSALVYEFIPNGSLDNHLFTRGPQLLSWETRIKVAIGAARGLSFLHEMKIIVTHEGVKSSSILLDDEFNPNLSDFDLARATSGLSNITPLVTNDYTAPEYTTKGRLTMKSDVYSFGIILLELLSGLRVLDHNRPVKDQNLIVWAKPYLSNKRKLLQIVDSRLEGEYPHDGAYTVGKLASQCLSLDPKRRPMMSEVADALEQLQCFNTEAKLSHPLSVGPRYLQNPSEPLLPAGNDIQRDQAGSSNWSVIGPEGSRSSGKNIFVSRNVVAIEYEEIRKATRNFLPDTMLGEGTYSYVYKGLIDENYLAAVKPGSGIVVAVKKMKHREDGGLTEWVDKISQLRHPNLVTPIGYSFDTDQRIFVYEFMRNGSLGNHLFRSGPQQSLPWATRIRVALGAARGLAFLHSLERPVIYQFLKCDNILLDGDFNAKLSDIGLPKDISRHEIEDPHGIRHKFWATYGPYAAPEYKAIGRLSTKCDVYSFGVVLCELITGRQAFDRTQLQGAVNHYFGSKGRLLRIMDRRLEGQYPLKEAYAVGRIGLQCASSDPRSRPTIAMVVAALQQL